MSKDEKPSVDIANRPSDRGGAHSAGEWVDHIWLREADDTRRDIRSARERLGQFSVRFVTEAIYGDDVARRIFGEDGGQELVRDVVIDRRVLHTLNDNVGGPRSQAVAKRMQAQEPAPQREQMPVTVDRSEEQIELLRALLKTMDPEVVRRALLGD